MDCVINSNTNGRQKWPNSKHSFRRKCCNSVASSVLLTNNSSTYEDCHLFVPPWVTDLDKLSFCPYPHHNSSCWSFAISSTWSMCPLLEILQFFSLHSTLLRHVLKRPPLFPTLNLWNLSCPSRHVHLASISDLSEAVRKNAVQSSGCFHCTNSNTTFSGVPWHSCANYWKSLSWQVFQ